ncbi:ABC transporter substrate-binding protein [uncultured Clostridium sp.]|uniref:ABC transporter substrate-binding protein n=1 Tax=uncultured Clostridium sp. TaxID=59620 RepID=UPI0025E8F22D|nr:ABC transporter substrate-binding protein [uncultured Clostridium sp.]
MKSKIKYGIIFLFILAVVILSINLNKPDKEQVLRGKIEIIAYESTYDYLVECADKFMELNDKTDVIVKKIYDKDEILEEINNNKITYIAQINRSDFDSIELEKSNYLEEQDNILNNYSKNFAKYRLGQVKYDDNSIGIPFLSRPLALYVREDMLEQYGYSREEMNTWDDVIKIGMDIYEKSKGKVRILNATGQDYDDLVSLLIMEYMSKDSDKEHVKSQVSAMLDALNNKNILNLYDGGEFLCRISSINAIKEIAAIDVECTWSVGNVPSISHGTSKFYGNEGDNLVVLNYITENNKLAEKFITYVMTNNSDAVNYVAQGKFFSSYLYTYKNKDIEIMPKNFVGNSPLVILDNIEEKANSIDDYSEYINIKNDILDS